MIFCDETNKGKNILIGAILFVYLSLICNQII